MSAGTSQSIGKALYERAQDAAYNDPKFSALTFRQKSDVLEYIREHGFEWEGDDVSAEEAARRAFEAVVS